MSKKLLFAAIASVAMGHAFADATTQTITTQDYVDNQDDAIYEYVDDELANKQDLIETDNWSPDSHYLPVYTTLVTSDMDNNNEIRGDTYGIMTGDALREVSGFYDGRGFLTLAGNEDAGSIVGSTVPTTATVADALYFIRNNMVIRRIPGVDRYIDSWGFERPITVVSERLNSDIKGSALVTKTNNCQVTGANLGTDGVDQTCASGERLIFEESNASGHGTTYTELEKIQIPTVGAMMTAISAATPTLPTGTANSIVMYNANGNIGGSRTIATSVGTNTSATTIPTTGAVVTGLNTKQNKMTCTRYVENAEQTDANCLLWSIN